MEDLMAEGGRSASLLPATTAPRLFAVHFILIFVLVLALFSWVRPAQAQRSMKIPRIGWLSPSSLTSDQPFLTAFREGLRQQGYREGESLILELRMAEGKGDRLPALAAELVRLPVDVIVTFSTPGARAAQAATRTIPIVVAVMGNPVESGLVASLARPGGNLTGLSMLASELDGKRLELVKSVVPGLSKAAMIWNSSNDSMHLRAKESLAAAQSLNVTLHSMGVANSDELINALAALGQQRPDLLLTLIDPFTYAHRTQIVEFAAKHRIPAIYESREFVDVGGLMSYGPSMTDLFLRSAGYVAKILKGARPADLPVEQPVKFDLIVNAKTANGIGLTIPPALLLRADQVIE
jgi:putative tryptophan/tyrosine transport system substrate-binding protein